FVVPPDVEFHEIEAATGRRAGPGCGPAIREVFVAGTEPTMPCLVGEIPPMPRSEEPDEVSIEHAERMVRHFMFGLPRALMSLFRGDRGLARRLENESARRRRDLQRRRYREERRGLDW